MEFRSLFVRRASALALSLLTLAAGCSDPPVVVPYDAPPDNPVVPEDVFIGTGNLVLAWTVRGMAPATGCAEAGGVSVRFPANFVQFMQDTTVPCTQGELRINDTAATLAAVTAELLDASGNVVHSFVVEANVMAGQTTTANIRFEPAGRLRITWTINGNRPATECAVVNARATQFRVQRAVPMAAACAAGSMTLSNVQVGPVNLTGELVFNSGDRRPWPTTKSMADVTSGATTTVEVDFMAMAAMGM